MTFDWLLFGCLVLVCVPGILIAARGSLTIIERRQKSHPLPLPVPER